MFTKWTLIKQPSPPGGVSVLYSGMYVYYTAKILGRHPPTYVVHNSIQQQHNTTLKPPEYDLVITV